MPAPGYCHCARVAVYVALRTPENNLFPARHKDMNDPETDDSDDELDDAFDEEDGDIGEETLASLLDEIDPGSGEPASGENARRRIEEYLEMKRAARELADIDGFDDD